MVLAGLFFFITTGYSFPSIDYFVKKQKFLWRVDRAKSFACNSSGALVTPWKELDKIVAATTRSQRRLVGAEKIGVRVGKIINRYSVAKHFNLSITDNSFSYERHSEKIVAEANLDGMYVIRTSVSESILDDPSTVKAYKSLSQV